jgi:hypothetical protein
MGKFFFTTIPMKAVPHTIFTTIPMNAVPHTIFTCISKVFT